VKIKYVLIIVIPCEEVSGLIGFMPIFETLEEAEQYRENAGYGNTPIEEFFFFEENPN